MIESLDWLNVKQLITYHTFKLINKLRLGQLSKYLYERIFNIILMYMIIILKIGMI